VDPDVTRPHTVPTIDLAQLPAYLLAPKVPVYLPGTTDLSSSPPCRCILHFVIPVIKDDDPTVNLEARWFVDYDLNGSAQSQAPAAVQVLAGSFNPTGLTRGPVVFDFDPVAHNISTTDTVNGSPHVIEMVIAEQQGFAPDTQNPPPVPPHRALLPGWDGTTFKIVVNVLASSAGRCDRNANVISPPLQRPGDTCQ
jgi:hypothetical protein